MNTPELAIMNINKLTSDPTAPEEWRGLLASGAESDDIDGRLTPPMPLAGESTTA